MEKEPFPDEIPADCPRKALRHILLSFTAHPATAGESYLQHLRFTTTMSLRLVLTGLALFVHGLLPFLFCRTTSRQSVEIQKIFHARSLLSGKKDEQGV